jgi:DNA-binding response OmpR family regulator
MNAKKILLLISHNKVGDRIEKAFLDSQFDVVRTDTPENAIALIENHQPHAILVDWDKANGTVQQIGRFIKENCRKTAMILISKNKRLDERIQAIEDGADDCLLLPQEIEELVAKVRALIRRIEMVDTNSRVIKIKDIEINLDTHEVSKAGKPVDLTYTQFKILYLLISRRDYVFSRNEILDKVWGDNVYVTNRTVDVHVKRLREKLGESKQPSRYIHTIHGMGYRFA